MAALAPEHGKLVRGLLLWASFMTISLNTVNGSPCSLRTVTSDHIVCVCNSTYCDTTPSVGKLDKGQYMVITTTKKGLRFDSEIFKATNTSKGQVIYQVNTQEKHQSVIGFGGAFTDAAGINIASLPEDAQDKLIASYFGPNGIGYNLGRVPIASCDFSTYPYSYDDVPGDLSLTHFALANEDFKYKIPYVKKAIEMSPVPIKIFGSPWSAPAWMKDSHNMTGKGSLIGKPGGPYYKAWANYFVRFLQEYERHGIKIWGVTVENEPTMGYVKNYKFQCMGFTPELERDFVKFDLGPALEEAGYGVGNLALMIFDDQRPYILDWMKKILNDSDASKFISGVAVHWYGDNKAPPSVLTDGHNLFPDKFILGTEACSGNNNKTHPVDLGSWDRGADYAGDIIGDLNNWVTGWTDWNIALDLGGGPNWVENFVDSPVIVDAKKGEFYKQPMFYVMGHFSKYLVPGSVWVQTKASQDKSSIQLTAFERPDKSIAVVIHNKGKQDIELDLTDGISGYAHVTSPGQAIQTVIWAL